MMKKFLFICLFILSNNANSSEESASITITVFEGDLIILNTVIYTLFDVESIVSLKNKSGYPVGKGVPLVNYASFFAEKDSGLNYALLDSGCMKVGFLSFLDKESKVLMCNKNKKIKLKVNKFKSK
jgi:hypothetical protein